MAWLFKGAVGLGLMTQMAVATTCADCELSEEAALLQVKDERTVLQSRKVDSYERKGCKKDIEAAQAEWKDLILFISSVYLANPSGDEFVEVARAGIEKLYGYDVGKVLFKPTLAAAHPFRTTATGALSYFVGYDAIKPKGFAEDGGFAINKGQGWGKVMFDNNKTDCIGDSVAHAMGHYYFTSASDPTSTTKVEYTFTYEFQDDGAMKIVAHHSSLPYTR